MTENTATQQPEGLPVSVHVTREGDATTVLFGVGNACVTVTWTVGMAYAEWKALDTLIANLGDALVQAQKLVVDQQQQDGEPDAGDAD